MQFHDLINNPMHDHFDIRQKLKLVQKILSASLHLHKLEFINHDSSN